MIETRHGFKVGDKVLFTNDYGLTFGPYVVTGFATDAQKLLNGADIFINTTAHWFPHKAVQLRKVQTMGD